jgi:hypothetical protein
MAAVSPDLVQDVVFGATLVVAGVEIVRSALAKAIASALVFLVAAVAAYGTFYL